MTEQLRLDPDTLFEEFSCRDRIEQYLDLLLEENQQLNLVSRETSRDDLRRLAAESIFPLKSIESGAGSYLDVGSGGGFPSIPIMLALEGAVTSPQTTLVERIGKKAAALQRLVSGLDLEPNVINMTLEDIKPPGSANLITIRLVKLTDKLLAVASRWLKPDGCILYYSQPDFHIDERKFHVKPISFVSVTGQSKTVSAIAKNS